MDFLAKQIAPPRNWEAFEELARALFAAVYVNPLAVKNGRRGQKQHGVDVYVERPDAPASWVGIQCKGKERNFGARATAKEFDTELAKAEKFKPGLDHWIFTTTASDDADLQAHARKVSANRAQAGKFTVDVLGWDALVALIAQHESVMRQFYPEHLSPATDDVARVRQASSDALASIDDALRHGTVEFSLLRKEHVSAAADTLARTGMVRLTGEGGVGKSGVLKRLAERFAGPTLILKDNRISPVTFRQYLGQLGVASEPEALLDALAGNQAALCVIDGADRLLMSERRALIIDLFRALAACQSRTQWSILTSARGYQDRDLVLDAMREAGLERPTEAIAIGGLAEEDSQSLALAFPAFAPLLSRRDLGGQNRSLFILRELLKRRHPPAGIWTEIDIADAWALGEPGEAGRAARRSAALAQIGNALVATPWQLPGRAEIDPDGLQMLIDEGSVIQLPNRDALRPTYDVHEDWLLARHLGSHPEKLPEALINADQPLWWLRAVRLSSQMLLDQGDYPRWRELLRRLEATEDLDPVWARTVLAAPLYSERADAVLDGLAPMLLEGEAALLRRLLDTLLVSETRLDGRMLAYLADQDETTRYTMAGYLKRPVFRSWASFLRWSLSHWPAWPAALIPRLSEIADLFARTTEQHPNAISQSLAPVVQNWLVEIEDARHPERWEDRREPFGTELEKYHAWEKVEDRLREALVGTVRSSPASMRAYLARLTASTELEEAREKLLESPGSVPSLMPREWADLCLRQFAAQRPRARRDSFIGTQVFDWHEFTDAGIRGNFRLSPASALRAGFDKLFEADPEQALRVFHRLERRASVYWRWYRKCHDREPPYPITLSFPNRTVTLWGDDPVYRWSRGILGSHILGSVYLALDDWLEREAANGRPASELIDLVLQDNGLVGTAAPLMAILSENINSDEMMEHAGPFLAVPRLWEYDVHRHVDDQGGAHRIGFLSVDNVHFQSIERNHQRHAKRSPMHHALLLPFRLRASAKAQAAFDAARIAWSAADLAEHPAELQSPGLVAERSAQIERYRSNGDPEQIVVEQREEGVQISIAPAEEILPEVEAIGAANILLNEAAGIANWVRRTREQNGPNNAMTIEGAIERATRLADELEDQGNEHLGLARRIGGQAIIGTAAIAARYLPMEALRSHRGWITSWLLLGAQAGEREEIEDQAILFDDFQALAAWGLAGLATRGVDETGFDTLLASLATHRIHALAEATLKGLIWTERPDFVRALHIAALDTCVIDVGWWWRSPGQRKRAKRRQAAARRRAAARACAVRALRAPLLPPAPDSWRWVWTGKWPLPLQRLFMPAKTMLSWGRALVLIGAIEWGRLTDGGKHRAPFGRYLEGLVDWTRDYAEGSERRDRRMPRKWAHGLAKTIGRFAMEHGRGSGWQRLTKFTYRDRAAELVGNYLEGVATALVMSGKTPDERFWSAWTPAADWIIETAIPKRRSNYDDLTHAARAAGLVGPYYTPLPTDWPHLEMVLPAVDRWVCATAHLPSAAHAVLQIVERMDTEQRIRWFLPWLSLWAGKYGSDEAFWSYLGQGNKAAALLKPLSTESGQTRSEVRALLAVLADAGSTVARELVVAFAPTRRG